MLGTLLEVAPDQPTPGLGVTHTPYSNWPSRKKAHNGQPKVNVRDQWPKKAVFSGHGTAKSRRTIGFPGLCVRFNEGERVSIAFSSEVAAGSREENASRQES
jgi:hypothetical protein